ncbi:MAG: alpha/beta hydrolase [Hyphomicrobiaceae bacterium]|nr:alpha/beta hydrolase [Hyphomicrobiaceae bacterium]
MQLNVDGTSVYAATGGRAFEAGRRTILFVHGAGLDHTNWQLPARWFAWHGWNVLAVDLPGHGRSQGPQLASVAEMAAWVARLMDAAGLDSAALVGHSMGASVALEVAAAAPDRVTRLALLGAGPAMPVNDALLTAARDTPAAAYALMTGWSLAHGSKIGGNPVPGLWLTGASMALLARNAAGTLHRDFLACAQWSTGPQAAGKVRCPTLLVTGANDQMTPVKVGRKLAQIIPGSAFESIPDCGHMLFAERPDAMLDALVRFYGD